MKCEMWITRCTSIVPTGMTSPLCQSQLLGTWWLPLADHICMYTNTMNIKGISLITCTAGKHNYYQVKNAYWFYPCILHNIIQQSTDKQLLSRPFLPHSLPLTGRGLGWALRCSISFPSLFPPVGHSSWRQCHTQEGAGNVLPACSQAPEGILMISFHCHIVLD